MERSFHYLNVDTLFLKIGQEMTPLQPFEVTLLIDFALDRSTSVTRDRDFAHCITMVARNVWECIQQMTARVEAVDCRKNELYSCSTDEERLDFLFQFSERDFLHSGPCILGVRNGFALNFSSSDAEWEDLSNGVYHGGSACSCWYIALWARRPSLSLLQAEKSVDKGLNQASPRLV